MKINTPSLQYKLATAADLANLNQLDLHSKAHWGYPQEWLDHWRLDMAITTQNLLDWKVIIVKKEDSILGFGALEIANDSYEIHHLWLWPVHLGKGYGGQLLNFLLETYCRESLPIKVVADPHAEGFYARLGFETIAQKESWPAGRFLPVMELRR